MNRRNLVSHLARLRDWFLLDLDRTALAVGFLLIALATFSWLELAGIVLPEQNNTPLLYLFSALAGGNMTLVTIVIAINQLVLSRELRSPRELETEVDAAEQYRSTVEEETEQAVIPEHPRDFLQILLASTRKEVQGLGIEADEDGSSGLRDELASLRSNIIQELDQTLESLEDSGLGVFPALSTILDADFSTRINHSRWIREVYAEGLSPEEKSDLEGIEQRLEHLDIARQYFKTIYIQQELAGLSKGVTYAGLVAEIVALSFLIYTGYLRTLPPLIGQPFVIPVAITISLSPLALLVAHVLRIATVAQRTVAITPFLSPR